MKTEETSRRDSNHPLGAVFKFKDEVISIIFGPFNLHKCLTRDFQRLEFLQTKTMTYSCANRLCKFGRTIYCIQLGWVYQSRLFSK